MVDGKGNYLTKESIQAILDMRTPENVTDVRVGLKAIQMLRRFHCRFGEALAGLNADSNKSNSRKLTVNFKLCSKEIGNKSFQLIFMKFIALIDLRYFI